MNSNKAVVADSSMHLSQADDLVDLAEDNERLAKIICDAIKNGYHACDESTPCWAEPRGGCNCWVAEAKLEVNWEK